MVTAAMKLGLALGGQLVDCNCLLVTELVPYIT